MLDSDWLMKFNQVSDLSTSASNAFVLSSVLYSFLLRNIVNTVTTLLYRTRVP